jgi:hypothetical protein
MINSKSTVKSYEKIVANKIAETIFYLLSDSF